MLCNDSLRDIGPRGFDTDRCCIVGIIVVESSDNNFGPLGIWSDTDFILPLVNDDDDDDDDD